jgi:hypothetical protein
MAANMFVCVCVYVCVSVCGVLLIVLEILLCTLMCDVEFVTWNLPTLIQTGPRQFEYGLISLILL